MGARDIALKPFLWLTSYSPRELLLMNNTVLAVCSVCLLAFALYMCAIFYQSAADSYKDETNGNGWIQWLGLAIVGAALSFTCFVGIRGAKIVSLELLLFYFWGIAFFLAPLLLATIMCFDFYTYVNVYFRHQWEHRTFLEIRKFFCDGNTADNKCISPILGGPDYDTVDAWCLGEHGSLDCASIREEAVNEAIVWSKLLTLVEATVCALNCVEIVFSMWLCFKILTLPVIHESMNDVINYLLAIPIAACVGLAFYLWWMREQDLEYSWLTDFYISMAVCISMLIPLGIVAGKIKSMDMLTTYIAILVTIICSLASAGIACMLFSVVLPEEFLPTSSDAAQIACSRKLSGCCCCDDPEVIGTEAMCPEWSKDEVVQLSVLDLKMAGIVSFLCLVYLLGALVVVGVYRERLKNYRMEYV